MNENKTARFEPYRPTDLLYIVIPILLIMLGTGIEFWFVLHTLW